MPPDSSKTIFSSFRRFFSGTLLSRFTGLAREVVMAAAFGTHPVIASFWMAYRFAHFFRRLLGEGALHIAFVPHFETLRKQKPEKAFQFFYTLSSHLTFFLLALTLLIEIACGSFLLWGECKSENREVLKLTMILLPALIFISLQALNSAFLQCEQSYFLAAASPAILNIIWIASIFWLWQKPLETSVHSLALLIVFGFIFQWLVTQIYAMRYLTIPKRASSDKKELTTILRPFLLAIVGVAATQVNNTLDALFARAADPEGPAILWYALRLQQLPLALLGVGLSGALLPPVTRALLENDLGRYKEFFKYSIQRINVLMIPITFGFFATGFSLVTLIYGRGAFNSHSILETSQALWAYASGLLPMTYVLIFAGPFYAMKNYKIPTFSSLASVLLNIFLNALFVFIFKMGSVSIALATSIASGFNALLLAYFLKKEGKFTSFPLLKIIILSSLAFILTSFAPPLSPSLHFLSQVKIFLYKAFIYSASLLLLAYLFKCQEITTLFQWIPQRLKKILES